MSNSTYNYSGKNEEGFTLIELSIVLVIIGLIVGGILTGQDLIKAAEQRATIAQIEKYNTAVNTFRNKYNGIPGDLSAASATAFGIANGVAFTGATGIADGNGIIQSSASDTKFVGEPPIFWMELGIAGLVDGNYTTNTLTTAGAIPTAVPTAAISTYMPQAKLGRGNSITVGSTGGVNYYVMAGISAITVAGVFTATNNMTAQESYNMDKKVDDGIPNAGSVFALDAVANNIGTDIATGSLVNTSATVGCVNSATTVTAYDLAATNPACSLRFRFN